MSPSTTEGPLAKLLSQEWAEFLKQEWPEFLEPLPPQEWAEFLLKQRPPKEAAEFLDISPGHLARMRSQGNGPPYSKLGANVRYQFLSLLAYAAARRRTTTREAA
jgi:hypothetical protein